jgi:hypothetical protein
MLPLPFQFSWLTKLSSFFNYALSTAGRAHPGAHDRD